MHTFKSILCVIVISLSAMAHVRGQEGAPPQAPQKYRLELVYIFEAGATEYIFVIGSAGFKSVESLKNFLSSLPPGTTLEWAPGCKRMGGEPLLSSAEELENFRAFCAERGIEFILVPSG